MTETRIAYTKPSIEDTEVSYATDAARNGWGAQCYSYLHRFETEFAAYLGVKHAIATSSCTGAMHMGLAGLGIGTGDEVILADTNWIATVSPVVHLGARPVFVDIDPRSWCIDPVRAEAAITPRTKAIIATHLYGNLADMDTLRAIAERHGVAVIEDAAEALGAVYHGQKAASMGHFGTFSFHGTKTLTTGEGGMFVTNDTSLFETVSTLSNHGRAASQSKQFWADMVGFKYKMSNIQAALGCAQLERINDLVSRKRDILDTYRTALCDIPGVTTNPVQENCDGGAWMPTIVFDTGLGITRTHFQNAFAAANIDARVFFYPLSAQPMFEDARHNTHAWSIPERAFNLPSYHDMSANDLARVIEVVRKLCA
ncbi:DegT/DnrJ/EryC1/StrS aminotransferase family protein [uncultured Ruegeria sp.]|uniref:DegT/DnrJ/EryC1/StrS family aminotransferase n=1 Tax=uncultured Ruegeria sp. TaxID=259304 RepID=UPI00263134AF|nr:DegT/DnrJ/EryC1/StrS family aminotransferase [uncultured Ruegeria sp.]